MTDDDEDNDDMSREEILERYGWKPGEREQIEADMAERQKRIDAEAREAAEREAVTRAQIIAAGRPPVVTRSYSAPAPAAAAEPDWNAWRKFILATVGKKFIDDEMLGKVLQKVGKICNERDEEIYQVTKQARDAIAALRAEVERLTAEVAELRALRSKPATVDEERQRAGEIRRARQKLAQLQVA